MGAEEQIIQTVIGGEQKRPPLLGKSQVLSYLTVLLARVVNARAEIPNWDDAEMGTDRKLFRMAQARRDNFWLHYGAAMSAIDLGFQLSQIDVEAYDKLKDAIGNLLVSARRGL